MSQDKPPKNKRVALTTWWNHHNYGTALQVTALNSVIESLGCDVDVINYIPHNKRYIVDYGGRLSVDWGRSERVVDYEREDKFNKYLARHLSFTGKCVNGKDFNRLNDEYDAFVCGSDQIWSPVVFDSRYFLDYVSDGRKKISYAPSMGPSYVENEYLRMKLSNLISKFLHLSVREKQGVQLINELTGRTAEVVVDPTLLLNYADWRKIIPGREAIKKRYILCHFLGENENARQHVKAISKQTGLLVKILPVFTKDSCYGEFQMGSGPEEYFNLIDNAEIVLTDSFHGAIFSVICSKPFYVFERFESQDKLSQNTRIYNFLRMAGLEDRLIGYHENVKNRYNFKINFKNAWEKINKEKEISLNFLKNSLNNHPLVSIIVPVYNVEKYIKDCLDSISDQTYKNIEIIVVDDGTQDRSGKIAEECTKRDRRIKVIHQKNGGLSVARNTGYNVANGEYIIFVDSDDAIAPDCVEYMLWLIETSKTNMAMAINYYDYYQRNQIQDDKIELIAADKIIEKIEYQIWGEQVWSKIYRKSYLDKYRIRHFPEILFGEGHTFNIYALDRAGDVAIGQRRVCYYRNNPESSTRKFAWDKRHQTMEPALQYRNKVISKKNKSLRRAFKYHVWANAFYIYKGILSLDDSEKYSKDLKKYCRRLRTEILGPLLADSLSIPREYKKWAIKVFLSPKKMAIKKNEEEAEYRRRELENSKANNFFDEMPWINDATLVKSDFMVDTRGVKDVEIEQMALELEYFSREIACRNAEIARLNDELLGIKRSAKLLLGNIKRKILHGRDRAGYGK